MDINRKYKKLEDCITRLGSVAVAFSGGVDSTYLLKVSHNLLGDRAFAVTARSVSFPKREQRVAAAFCEKEGIRQIFCDTEELSIEGFSQNPVNRCYLCKSEMFRAIRRAARENGAVYVAEGSNTDDTRDYRPGLAALEEQGIKSPLRHAGLSKEEIRRLSKEMGLSTWDHPSFACLISRFPYGESVTRERLLMVERAEQLLFDMGMRQVRVRFHGNLARIETNEDGFAMLADPQRRRFVYDEFTNIGFTYISVDLLGYREGSMNETLTEDEKRQG